MMRAQVAEGLCLATNPRAAVAAYYAKYGVYPDGNAGAGVPLPSSINVRSFTKDANGRIAFVHGNTASLRVAGQTLQLALQQERDGLHWDLQRTPATIPAIGMPLISSRALQP